MRVGKWDYKQFIHNMKILDQEILDLSPPSSKFEGKKITKSSQPSKLPE